MTRRLTSSRALCGARLSFVLLAALFAALAAGPVWAVAITGYGPGGFEDNNGADNLVLWFRSDVGLFQNTAGTIAATASNDPVARWNDQSGYGRNMTTFGANPTAAVLQLAQINGRSIVRVDNNTGGGFPSSLRTPSFTLNQPEHVWSTHAFTGGDGINPTVWDGFNLNQMRLFGAGGAGSTSFYMWAGSGLVGAVGTVGTYHNLGSLYNGASSTFRTDGNQVATGNVSGTNAGGLSIGGGVWGSGEGADADFAEIFVFDRELNSTERIIVDNYQSSASNIAFAGAVAANDHYQGDTGGNGNYDFGVFGIGNDGTNTVTSAGMDGFGAEQIGGSLGSNEWVFGGHTSAANSLVTLEGDPNEIIGDRWSRAYYLDKTGGVDATLAFDWEDSGLSTPGGTNTYHLLYSPDNDFSNGWTELANTTLITSGTVTFNVLNAQLLDGYYTLGLNIANVPEPATCLLVALGGIGLACSARRRAGRRS